MRQFSQRSLITTRFTTRHNNHGSNRPNFPNVRCQSIRRKTRHARSLPSKYMFNHTITNRVRRVTSTITFTIFHRHHIRPFSSVLQVISVRLSPTSFNNILIQRTSTTIIRQRMRLLTTHVISTRHSITIRFIFLNLNIQSIAVQLTQARTQRINRRVSTIRRNTIARRRIRRLTLQIRCILSSRLNPNNRNRHLNNRSTNTRTNR